MFSFCFTSIQSTESSLYLNVGLERYKPSRAGDRGSDCHTFSVTLGESLPLLVPFRFPLREKGGGRWENLSELQQEVPGRGQGCCASHIIASVCLTAHRTLTASRQFTFYKHQWVANSLSSFLEAPCVPCSLSPTLPRWKGDETFN